MIHPLWSIVPSGIWIGMIVSISFMEAWMKFRAPGITLSSGLEIGKLVFSALKKMEWVVAGIVCFLLLLSGKSSERRNMLVVVAVLVLALQTVWLLPELDKRADRIIAGLPVGPSNLHVIFIACEVAKVVSLIVFTAIVQLRTVRKKIKT
ncbi:MAG TPA: hypothetical protein VFW11_21450 [Cyclobacteriaceae bacterium]|nr:hypothetical protein [Cyclobacteriaceae bacterium]